MLPNPVVNNLEINYKLTRRASIWFSVHNNIGIPMCATIPQTLNEGSHLETIKMEHLITGTYMIFVHVDNMGDKKSDNKEIAYNMKRILYIIIFMGIVLNVNSQSSNQNY